MISSSHLQSHLTDKNPPPTSKRLWGKSTLCRNYIRYTCTCRRTLTDTPNNVCPSPKDNSHCQISACRMAAGLPPGPLLVFYPQDSFSCSFWPWAVILWPPHVSPSSPLALISAVLGPGELAGLGSQPAASLPLCASSLQLA